MQSTIEHIETIVAKAGELAETKAELWKLKAAGKISETASSLISIIAITLLASITLIFLSIGIAIWIGTEMGNPYAGFFITGGFYALAGLFIYLFRKYWIKKPVSDLIIDKIMK